MDAAERLRRRGGELDVDRVETCRWPEGRVFPLKRALRLNGNRLRTSTYELASDRDSYSGSDVIIVGVWRTGGRAVQSPSRLTFVLVRRGVVLALLIAVAARAQAQRSP